MGAVADGEHVSGNGAARVKGECNVLDKMRDRMWHSGSDINHAGWLRGAGCRAGDCLYMPHPFQIWEYACHEGNYSMANMLSGARADERAEADAATKKQRK